MNTVTTLLWAGLAALCLSTHVSHAAKADDGDDNPCDSYAAYLIMKSDNGDTEFDDEETRDMRRWISACRVSKRKPSCKDTLVLIKRHKINVPSQFAVECRN